MLDLTMARRSLTRDRKSTRLNSSHTVIYTLSLHDALPIFISVLTRKISAEKAQLNRRLRQLDAGPNNGKKIAHARSEEHTSELQSHSDLHSFPTRRSSDLHLGVNPQNISRKSTTQSATAAARCWT